MRIVLLYNDRDKDIIRPIWKEFRIRGLQAWFGAEQIDAFGDLFEQIDQEIAVADAIVFFIGTHGLGRFQRNIELVTALWKSQASAKKLTVLVAPISADALIPDELVQFPCLDYFAEDQRRVLVDRITQLVASSVAA